MPKDEEFVSSDTGRSQGHLWTCCIPESVVSISSHNVLSLAFGEEHCLYATFEGKVYSFGHGSSGQLGVGTLEDHLNDPCLVNIPDIKFVSVSCGPRNSAALSVDGDIYMWGENGSKQCAAEYSPVVSPFLIQAYDMVDLCRKCDAGKSCKVKFLQVACGGMHTLALSENHEIWAWGSGPQLGLSVLETAAPMKLNPIEGRKVLTIACGYLHSIAVLQLSTDDGPDASDEEATLCVKCSEEQVRPEHAKQDNVCPLGLHITEGAEHVGSVSDQMQDMTNAECSCATTEAHGAEGTEEGYNVPIFNDLDQVNAEVNNTPAIGTEGIDIAIECTESAPESSSMPPQCTSENANSNVRNSVDTVNDGLNNGNGSTEVLLRTSAEPPSSPTNPLRPRCRSSLIDPQSAKDFLDRTLYPLSIKEEVKRSYTFCEKATSLSSDTAVSDAKFSSPSFLKELISRMRITTDRYTLVNSGRSGTSQSRDSTSSQESFEVIDVGSSMDVALSPPKSGVMIQRSNSYKSLLELKQLHRSKASKPGGSLTESMTTIDVKHTKGNKLSCHNHITKKKCPHSEVWTWGRDDFGQLGHGEQTDRCEPCCMKQLSGQNAVQVAAGKHHSLARTADGRVFSWGSNEFGQLGHSGLTGCSLIPKLIDIPPHEMVWDIAAGESHSVFLADLRSPQVALYYSGCHSNKLQCMCENIHKVQKLHILKKCGLVRSVFAGGPYSGCTVDRQSSGQVPTEHEFAASERKYLQHLKLIMHKIFRPLLKEGSFLEEPPQCFVQPMSHLIALWSELIDKVSMNAYDLTLLVQGRSTLETVYMLESSDEWLELHWSYIQALCNALSVNGAGACVKFMCLSPNMMKPVLKSVFGDAFSAQKSTLENFQLLMAYPLRRIKEYVNLLNRCLSVSSKMCENAIHAAISQWQQLLESATRDKQLAMSTCQFWESVPQKVVDLYQAPSRRVILESRSHPLTLTSAGRFSSHWFTLFSDIFMHCHFSAYESYPLQLVWVEPIPDSDNLQNAFTITLPEDTFTLTCRSSVEKTEWVCALNQAIKKTLSEAKHPHKKPGQSYDHRLTPPLARQAVYSFTRHPSLKDAVYSGTWLCGRLHGHGELTWPDGRKYVGNFKNNIQDGEGIYTVLSSEGKTVYQGTWKDGKLNGLGSVRYPSGDMYEGYFKEGLRHGYGILKQGQFLTSAALVYIGSWNNNKRQGYGVLDDIQKGEKYMGTWLEDCRSGNGIVVTIDGIYYEGTFLADKLSGFGVMIFEDNTWYEGDLAPDGMLSGKGILHLSNGDKIEGTFSGLWSEGIKVGGMYHKSTGTPPQTPDVSFGKSEHLPRSFSQMSVPADMKWEVLFQHCRESLGIQSNNATLDNQHAWEAVAVAINQKKKEMAGSKRWQILQDESFEVLERIPRAGTDQGAITPETYREICDYLAKACDCPYHPLGKLVGNLVDVYRAAYLGVGANPRLLPHAVAEIQSFVKRFYRILRVLFPSLPPEDVPFMIPCTDSKLSNGPSINSEDAEVDGELLTSSTLIHPLLLPRMYPPLFMLYALHNEKEDSSYWERLVKWNKQSDLSLMAFLGVNLKFSIIDIRKEISKGNTKSLSTIKDASYLKAIETLQHISTTFTPLEKLKVLCQAFEEITKEVQKKLGNDFIWSMDDLFPVFQYVVVRARIRHLGSEIHLIENLMDEHLCYGELGIMCTTLKACYYQIKTEKLALT